MMFDCIILFKSLLCHNFYHVLLLDHPTHFLQFRTLHLLMISTVLGEYSYPWKIFQRSALLSELMNFTLVPVISAKSDCLIFFNHLKAISILERR